MGPALIRDLSVAAPGTLTVDVPLEGPADRDPSPEGGVYQWIDETADYEYSPVHVEFSLADGSFADYSDGLQGGASIGNTPSGDYIWSSGYNGGGEYVYLHLEDTSANALASDAWTQRYERRNWQTIEFINESPRAGYGYTVRIPTAEAEALGVQAKSAIGAGIFSDSRLCGGGGTWVSTNAAGQFITYTVPVHQPGTYVVRTGVRTSPNKGKFQLAINGINQGPVQDEYSPSVSNGFRDLGITTFFATGNQPFRFTVTGRNPSSTGYSLAFDFVDLIPTRRLETEWLKVKGITPAPVGTTSAQWSGVFNASAASNGSGTYLNATAPGQFVTYTVPVTKAGTYRVRVGIQTKPNKGKFRLAINGVTQGLAQDEYSSTVGYSERGLGKVYLNPGNHAFKFSVTGKNASSTGYSLAFDYIDSIPQ